MLLSIMRGSGGSGRGARGRGASRLDCFWPMVVDVKRGRSLNDYFCDLAQVREGKQSRSKLKSGKAQPRGHELPRPFSLRRV
jgi:hypothetical protein